MFCVAFVTVYCSVVLCIVILYSNKMERLQPIVVSLNNKAINQSINSHKQLTTGDSLRNAMISSSQPLSLVYFLQMSLVG